jgi:PIN domain nuclease of toxin-antitoxin system
MTYVLDTHVFLWAMVEPKNLSQPAAKIIENEQNELLLSSVVVWEIGIKRKIGKIVFKKNNLEIFIHRVIEESGFIPLPITIAHALEMENLPGIHRDPFDRMLISQARVEKAILITPDRIIQSYDVKTVW